MSFQRAGNRDRDQMREVIIERGFTQHAEGSVLVAFGHTKVICTASISRGVPSFLRGSGKGWITSEYGMLPRSTGTRMDREAVKGKQAGRSVEIQRLIGRALRACVDMNRLGEKTIRLDCDVIQADGGTRTAAITGACIALYDAVQSMKVSDAFIQFVAAVSVGIVSSTPLLDLEYSEDAKAETDMNVVMTEGGEFIEVQGAAEGAPFSRLELNEMLVLAEKGTAELLQLQRKAITDF